MTAMSRRDLFKLAGLSAGVTTAGLVLPLGESASTADWISTAAKPARFARRLFVPQAVTPTPMSDEYGDYLLYEITERASSAQILDAGAPSTPVLGYAVGGGVPTVPGPLIKVDQHTRVRMRVTNALPTTHPSFGYAGVDTSVHLHGSASLPQYDGYADDVTSPGHHKDYWYPNHQGPRTLWYHDHGMHHTAQNAYSGLFAQYHISNAWERENLPQGQYDVPLVVTDAMFAKDGQLAYMDRDHSGLWGDVIMVNGVPWPFHEVERRFYRFRVLLATLSRSMNLKFVNVRTKATLPTYVVATDGGLTVPQKVTNWRHAGAERYEVMVDFKDCRVGDTVELRNSSNKNNVDYLHTGKVMQFRVTSDPTESRWNAVVTPPAAQLHPVMRKTRADSRRTRNIDLEHDDRTNEFMINGMSWADVQAGSLNVFTDDGGSPRVPGTARCGGSRTSRAGGTTRSTSTWSTSRSSAGAGAPGRCSPGRRDPRTSSTSARARSSRCWSSTPWHRRPTPTAGPPVRPA